MKKFILSFVLLLGLMCVTPQSAFASNGTLDNTEVVVTYDKNTKWTTITVLSNGKIKSYAVRDANGNIIFTYDGE